MLIDRLRKAAGVRARRENLAALARPLE